MSGYLVTSLSLGALGHNLGCGAPGQTTESFLFHCHRVTVPAPPKHAPTVFLSSQSRGPLPPLGLLPPLRSMVRARWGPGHPLPPLTAPCEHGGSPFSGASPRSPRSCSRRVPSLAPTNPHNSSQVSVFFTLKWRMPRAQPPSPSPLLSDRTGPQFPESSASAAPARPPRRTLSSTPPPHTGGHTGVSPERPAVPPRGLGRRRDGAAPGSGVGGGGEARGTRSPPPGASARPPPSDSAGGAGPARPGGPRTGRWRRHEPGSRLAQRGRPARAPSVRTWRANSWNPPNRPPDSLEGTPEVPP